MDILRKSLAVVLVAAIFLSLGLTAFGDSEPDVGDVSWEENVIPENEIYIEAEAAADIPESTEPPAPAYEEDTFLVIDEYAQFDPDFPAEEIPAEETPAEEIPAEETPAEETPAAEIPSEETPAAETPAPVPEDPEDTPVPTATPDGVIVVDPLTEEDELASEEPADAKASDEPRPWVEPGNTAAEILSGGRYVYDGGTLYFSDGGIWMDNGYASYLSGDDATNLNVSGGWLYYTVYNTVYRMPLGGGGAESVYSFESDIRQLYVMGDELRFLSGGSVYSYDMVTQELVTMENSGTIMGLIPTEYGNLYLTGDIMDYTLWAGETAVYYGVQRCYTDSGWLVIVTGGETYMASVEEMFTSGTCSLQGYGLHTEYTGSGLSEDAQLAAEADYLSSDEYALMQDGLSMSVDGAYTSSNSNIAKTVLRDIPIHPDQFNIVRRARQMSDVEWTPREWRYAWGGDNSYYNSDHSNNVTSTDGTVTTGYFVGGKTYKGVPYSQAVNTGYVGWDLSLDDFLDAVNNNTSNFYSGYSSYSRTAPYYGSDCSGFVSWAWDLPTRCTCTSILAYCYRVENSIGNLQVGDAINEPSSHIVLVTNIGYDANGNVNAVEITEQTPSKMRVSCYGELIPGRNYDRTGSLSFIQQYYFNSGYSIYRRSYSGEVSYTETKYSKYLSAPQIGLNINSAGTARVVTLSHPKGNYTIYYTTDGSTPTRKSNKYTGPFEITKDTVIKAAADPGSDYSGSFLLTYKAKVSKAEAPALSLVEGALQGTTVSSGSKITLKNADNDTIYYTTDGSTPTTSSTKASAEGFTITGDTTIKAIAVSTSKLTSDVKTITVKVGTFYKVSASAGTGGSITPGDTMVLSGKNATFKIKPQEYYEISDVLVDGKSVGQVESYTFSNVKETHTIQAKFRIALPFKDVKSQWYADSVGFVYSKGLFSGTAADTFSPNAKMTRGMFITVLGRFVSGGEWKDLENWSGYLGFTNGYRIAIRDRTTTAEASEILAETGSALERVHVISKVPKGTDGNYWYKVEYNGTTGYMRRSLGGDNDKTLLYVYEGGFKDLKDGAYYTGYAQWAYIYGIMNGMSSTSFSPNSNITRQDICVLLYRYLSQYSEKSISTEANAFTDSSSVSGYAKDAVNAMRNIGVITGYEDGSFRPKGYATRAEVATMFQRLYTWMYG